MTIQQLQYILEIYRTASISMAAENLFVAQANLSNAVRALEKELGFPIFIRSNKGVRPTQAGMRVIEQAGEIMVHQKKILSIKNTNSISCHIGGLIYTPVREAYIKLCLEQSDMERIDISYNIVSFSEAVEQLFLSTIDVAVCFSGRSSVPQRQRLAESKGLQMEELCKVPLVIRIGPKHPLYKEANIELSEFSKYIFVDSPNSTYLYNNEFLAVMKPDMRRIVRVSDPESKQRLVSASDTMYSVGAKLPREFNQRYMFRSIPICSMDSYTMSILSRKGKKSPEVCRYIQLLQEEMENL